MDGGMETGGMEARGRDVWRREGGRDGGGREGWRREGGMDGGMETGAGVDLKQNSR